MKKLVLLLLFLAVSTLLFAGGRKEQSEQNPYAWVMKESDDSVLPGVNPLQVSGSIITAGSSTVFPLSERMVERFKDEGFMDNITVDSIGSGAGFERWAVAGETDISNASRPIKEKEIENARKIGREPIEFRIGTDALAVVVNKENEFIQNATYQELVRLFSSAEKWSDVNPSWPKEEIQRFIPGTDSGTFDLACHILGH